MEKELLNYREYLISEEKSKNTIEKYIRDVKVFLEFLKGREITKAKVIGYKEKLQEEYKTASINSMLVAVNNYLKYKGKHNLCVKLLKYQQKIFLEQEKELTSSEYKRLVRVAEKSRIGYVIKTICSTGIRVSELKHITVEAVEKGRVTVRSKGKERVIFIPNTLKEMLNEYIKKSGIKTGSVFVTKSGRPLYRSNIWREMKNLCRKAGVDAKKVFPHNLRHLFARTFYNIEKDIVRLADILGHSSVNTTRIYTMESGKRHIKKLDTVQRFLIT